jgi:copper chaperone NosL
MNVRFRWPHLFGCTAALAALLAGCGAGHTPLPTAAAVHVDDACAVCGMYLGDAPGPRGQAWIEGQRRPVIFDSVRDFFAWALQPDHQAGVQALFVQDTARIDWQRPAGEGTTFIDARQAFYVAWQPLPGSMGPTFAPFSTRAAAEAFARRHGGAVLAFGEVTPTLVANLQAKCPGNSTEAGGHAISCHPPANPVDGIPPLQHAR